MIRITAWYRRVTVTFDCEEGREKESMRARGRERERERERGKEREREREKEREGGREEVSE
eukprot:3518174-Rhodomonas_salina.1